MVAEHCKQPLVTDSVPPRDADFRGNSSSTSFFISWSVDEFNLMSSIDPPTPVATTIIMTSIPLNDDDGWRWPVGGLRVYIYIPLTERIHAWRRQTTNHAVPALTDRFSSTEVELCSLFLRSAQAVSRVVHSVGLLGGRDVARGIDLRSRKRTASSRKEKWPAVKQLSANVLGEWTRQHSHNATLCSSVVSAWRPLNVSMTFCIIEMRWIGWWINVQSDLPASIAHPLWDIIGKLWKRRFAIQRMLTCG